MSLHPGRRAAALSACFVLAACEQLAEPLTYAEPHRLARGFDTVIIKGRLAFTAGHATGAFSGRVLRPRDGPDH